MKPIIIITISVGVSVGTVLGIIFGILNMEIDVDYSDIALVLSIITASAVSIVAIASVSASKATKKLGMAQLMEGIDNTLQNTMAMEDKLENRTADYQHCDNYVTTFLNTLDRIAYAKKQGAFDESVINFYKPFLEYGLVLLEWKTRTYAKDQTTVYSNLIEVCKNQNFSKPDWNSLHHQLKEMTEHYETKREKDKKIEEAKSETDSSSQDKIQEDSENS